MILVNNKDTVGALLLFICGGYLCTHDVSVCIYVHVHLLECCDFFALIQVKFTFYFLSVRSLLCTFTLKENVFSRTSNSRDGNVDLSFHHFGLD